MVLGNYAKGLILVQMSSLQEMVADCHCYSGNVSLQGHLIFLNASYRFISWRKME